MDSINPFDGTEEDDFFSYMIENDYIVVVGIDRHGENVYRMTKKMIKDFPEVFEDHLAMTNELVFAAWQKDLVDVTMTEDGEWRIKANEKTLKFEEMSDQLTDEEYLLLMEISRLNKES